MLEVSTEIRTRMPYFQCGSKNTKQNKTKQNKTKQNKTKQNNHRLMTRRKIDVGPAYKIPSSKCNNFLTNSSSLLVFLNSLVKIKVSTMFFKS